MDAISYEYPKQRREFGIHPLFGDSPQHTVSVTRDASAAKQWTRTIKTTVELDCIPQRAQHEANTKQFLSSQVGNSHTDGAWPSEVKTNEYNDRQRLLRRIKNEASYQQAVCDLVKVAEVAIQQNNTLDLYQKYFSGHVDWEQASSEPPSCKTVQVFRDPNEVKRSVTKICWHPESNMIAVSYSILEFQQEADKMSFNSYIWDLANPNTPVSTLKPLSPLCCLTFNPRSPDQLVGGSYNGLVSFWDLRKGGMPVACSLLEKSHHDPVYDLFFIQSRTGSECCSVSTDGRVLWWDTRQVEHLEPTDEMTLSNSAGENPEDINYGGSTLEYRSDAGATKYLVGTEQGIVLLAERKAKKDEASTFSIKNVFGTTGGKHMGPITSLQRNPFSIKAFLTVGDWSARVWVEDVKTPLFTTPFDPTYLTGGCWSPTRPCVFFTIKRNGTLDIWDLLQKQSASIFSTKIGEVALTSIAVQANGRLVAVGSEDGTTTVIELSASLYEMANNEKAFMANLVERDTKRERHLEMRQIQKTREASSKAKEADKEPEPAFNPEADDDEETKKAMATAEEEFNTHQEKWAAAAVAEEEAAAKATEVKPEEEAAPAEEAPPEEEE